MYKALEKFGFGPNFIAWIKLCYTDISSAVKVNGYLSEYFKLERGVRQGCCLSMGLYTIVAEYIAAMIRNEPKIKGILLPNNVECKLSQYVDDTQIFISDVSSTDTVLSSFRLIQAATGASLNLEKTEGLWLGSFKGRQDKPGNMKWSSDSIKVLGVHVGNLDQSEGNWSSRIEKFCCALNMWSQRDLSVYGKSIIANVIASSKLWYYSNVLYVPDWVIAKLSSLIVEFMWSNKRHLVSKLSVSQRQGIIVLLYKKGDNALLKNWRPISLLNIDYKIMSSVQQVTYCTTFYHQYRSNWSCSRKIHSTIHIVN